MASMMSQATAATHARGVSSTRCAPNSMINASLRQQATMPAVTPHAASFLPENGAAAMPLKLHDTRSDLRKTTVQYASSESDAETDKVGNTIVDGQREASSERRRRRMASWGKPGSFPVVTGNLEEVKPNNLDF